MSAPALAAPGGRALTIRGTPYPVLLPTLRDPRLHLAAVIFSLHALGQIAFDFRVSIAQILISLGTCAALESGIAFARQGVIMWPASALITGNGVAFILRLPGTRHGDWWSLHGWYYYAGAAAVGLLSKHVIRFGGRHIFNPSNFGLVLVFLIFREGRAEPLDFWWGPMGAWMIAALAIIVCGGLAILYRLRLLPIAVAFWLTFAAGIAVIAAAGHAMSARWHVGPVTGFFFWWVLVTSPEILVFLFFMLSDPKTIPATKRARIAYAIGVGVLATLLIAPARTEFWSKVAVLGALLVVCAAWPLLERYGPRVTLGRTALALSGVAVLALYAGGLVAAGIPARPPGLAAPLTHTGRLPAVSIGKSKGVSQTLGRKTARTMAADLVADLQLQARALARRDIKALGRTATFARLPELRKQVWAAAGAAIVVPAYRLDRMAVHYSVGSGQSAAVAVATLDGTQQLTTYLGRQAKVKRRERPTAYHQSVDLQLSGGRWLVARIRGPHAVPTLPGPSPLVLAAAKSELAGVRLTDVAKQVGLDFRQDDFRFGMWNDVHSMMGGGLCWLDYNNDGWLDLFVVNSYSDADVPTWNARGGLPRSALFENVHGRFVDVSAHSHANVAVQGNGCVAADLNGDGYTDLLITTNVYNVLLWNNGNGTFSNGTRAAGIDALGTYAWHTGAAVADVNGDGRPDIFVSGYADVNAPSRSSGGFPLNYQAFRDLLYLNEGPDAHGHSRFRDVARRAGIERAHVDHGLGAEFTDVNADGRPDLYVANDLDPNRLYLNEKGGPLGFHFVESAKQFGVADRNAGMGIAVSDLNFENKPNYLFVTNSRGQQHAAFATRCNGEDCGFADARRSFDPAFGTNFTGWGDTWIDLANDGTQELVVANGDIPVASLRKSAGRVQVIAKASGNWLDATSLVGAAGLPAVNGRGVAAADFDNDGHVDLAVNSIGGRLMLLRSTGGSGHWLEVDLKPFVPGAIVTVSLPTEQLAQETHAGSSYLSSEDPRLHFGLGSARRASEVDVKLPGGKTIRLKNVRADQIVSVRP
jgi:FG-GAP-like repeat/ASPIC and UnbV